MLQQTTSDNYIWLIRYLSDYAMIPLCMLGNFISVWIYTVIELFCLIFPQLNSYPKKLQFAAYGQFVCRFTRNIKSALAERIVLTKNVQFYPYI
mgnify:CR=1 FL=1